jgi:predicted Rossmann fold nucleotide-binding protein DprA/Smf involved in DNA uptake
VRAATRIGVSEAPEPFTPLPVDLSDVRRTLLENLGHDPTEIDELIRYNGLPSAIVHAALLELELGGIVSILPNNRACLITL